jgi:nucleoid-associated protein YgaU
MKQRLLLIGAGVVLLLVVGRVVLARASGGDIAVDTTGASAQAGTAGQSTPDAASAAAGLTTGSAATPSATVTVKPSGPTPTPVVVQIQGTAVSIEAKPLLLLNPATVRQGSSVGVTGSGFDPGTTVDIYVKQQPTDSTDPLTFVQVDKSGGFGGVSFAVPDSLPRGNFIVEADERDSGNVARATAVIAGGSPQVKLGTQASKSGDTVQLSAAGFSPNENINVYWNDLSTDIIGTLQADDSGGLRQGSVRVPFGAVGNNAFIFVGDNSQSPVTVPFQLLNLYPSVDLSSYAIKPDNVLSFSGKDFGPGEQVSVYLNNPDGPALTTIQTDDDGTFTNSGGFLVPFGLEGKQTLIFIGGQSKAPTTASFDTLPYTPSAQPSTYGGRPGTTLTFYAIGFARNEIVHAFVGQTQDNPGTEVSCFRTDGQGNAASGGSYVVPGDASPGQLVFSLTGSRSNSTATAALEVIASDVPVQVPPQEPFQCDLTDGPDAPQVVGPVDQSSIDADPSMTAAAQPATGGQPRLSSNPAAIQASPSPFASPSPAPKSGATQKASATPSASPTTDAKASATPDPKAAKASPSPNAKASASPQPSATPKASTTPDAKASATAKAKAATDAKASATAKASPAADASATAEPSSSADAAAPAASTAADPSNAASPAGAADAPRTYTVQEGDTLLSIAAHVYGDPSQWTKLYDANKDLVGSDPSQVQVGSQLTIPPKES